MTTDKPSVRWKAGAAPGDFVLTVEEPRLHGSTMYIAYGSAIMAVLEHFTLSYCDQPRFVQLLRAILAHSDSIPAELFLNEMTPARISILEGDRAVE